MEGIFMSNEQLPIEALVSDRCKELGLRPVELIQRCGYKNISKGLRRLEQLCNANFRSSRALIHALPSALDLPEDLVTKAVEDTERQIHEAEEAAWRAQFVPHAVVLTESERPTQLFVAIFLGIERLLRVDFDLSESPATYLQQAIEGVRQRVGEWKPGEIPTFGKPVGVIVNYSPDHAVRFDLEGKAVAVLDRAYRLGEATFSIGKRRVSREELDALFLGQSRLRRPSSP